MQCPHDGEKANTRVSWSPAGNAMLTSWPFRSLPVSGGSFTPTRVCWNDFKESTSPRRRSFSRTTHQFESARSEPSDDNTMTRLVRHFPVASRRFQLLLYDSWRVGEPVGCGTCAPQWGRRGWSLNLSAALPVKASFTCSSRLAPLKRYIGRPCPVTPSPGWVESSQATLRSSAGRCRRSMPPRPPG